MLELAPSVDAESAELAQLRRENALLRHALGPFASVVDAFDTNMLMKARRQWSDREGDQNGIPLFADKEGTSLLYFYDFVVAKEALAGKSFAVVELPSLIRKARNL